MSVHRHPCTRLYRVRREAPSRRAYVPSWRVLSCTYVVMYPHDSSVHLSLTVPCQRVKIEGPDNITKEGAMTWQRKSKSTTVRPTFSLCTVPVVSVAECSRTTVAVRTWTKVPNGSTRSPRTGTAIA